MVGDADGVGDDGEGRVDGAAAGEEAGVDYVEVVEVVGLAVDVEDGLFGVGAEAAGAVLVADAFEGDAFFEVGVEGDGAFGVAGLFEDVDPAVFEAVEGFDVVVGVGELDLRGAVGAGVEGDAVVGVGEVFGHEPPGDGVVFHGFEDEAGGEGWGVALHHLVVEAADWLDEPMGKSYSPLGSRK